MHEQQKIDEAARFLKRMQDDANDPTAFKDDLSAFLTAARSALQYAHKEMTTHNKPGGQGWWKGISKLTLVGFFQDKRDINVHVRPVPPRVVADTQTEDFLPLADVADCGLVRPDGTGFPLTRRVPKQSIPEETEGSVMYSYTFADWTGLEDVLTLCAAYLDEVRNAVNDGIAKGFC